VITVSELPFTISFPGVSIAEANRYAADLQTAIRETDESITAERRRSREDAQDFGATLIIVLGTASVTALANGISAWLARHSGAKIQIEADGSIVASDLDSRDASRIAAAFRPRN
jgi:hypothetical protein